MKLYLMRHGETDYNKTRYFYGSTDVSINETGRAQALLLKEVMRDCPVKVIYVSSLKRSLETAEIVFENTLHLIGLSSLDEKGFGLWEGMTADQIQKLYPREWEAWLEKPFEVTPPEAEPFSDFQQRVWQAIDTIIDQENGQALAIVAHLGVLRLIYQRLVDAKAVFWDIDFPQGTVRLLRRLKSGQYQSQLLRKETADDKNSKGQGTANTCPHD